MKNLMGPVENRILFTAYHNHNISEEELLSKNIKRIDNWSDLVKYIKSL